MRRVQETMKLMNVTDQLAERLKKLKKIEQIQEVAIPFFTDEMFAKKDDASSDDLDKKPNTIGFDLYTDPHGENSVTVKHYVEVLGSKEVTPEEWCTYRHLMETIVYEGLGYNADEDAYGRGPTDVNAHNR